jgi:uncharacterized SAM-binding protein YcdF (DUF218 family)
LFWLLLSPASLMVLLLVTAYVCLRLGWQGLAQRLLGFTLVCLLLISCLPIDEWLAYPLERQFLADPALPSEVTGIIVLGGAIETLTSASWQQPQMNHAGERVLAFYQLAKRFPNAALIYTGGSGQLLHQDKPEADVAGTLYESLGIQHRIIFENASRNTHENVVESRKLAQPLPGQQWVLITSASHMPRAVGIFCAQQWPVIAFPVDHESSPGRLLRLEFDPADNLYRLNRIIREWIGLLAYFVTGKTTDLFPAGCSQPST